MRTIRPLDLHEMLEASQPVEIVDLRPRGRFERTHIHGAHWLPANAALSLETLFSSRELLPTEPLYLVSESGALARLTAHELERRGVNNVIVVSGGMRGWQQSGLPATGRIGPFQSGPSRSATNAQFLTTSEEHRCTPLSKVSIKCN